MNAPAVDPTPSLSRRRSPPSFLSTVRRLLWDAGHRASNPRDVPPSSSSSGAGAGAADGTSPLTADVSGRKRPRTAHDEEAEEETVEQDGGGLFGNLGSPPHLAPSAKKATAPTRGDAASVASMSASSLSSSDEESAGEESVRRGGGGANGAVALPPTKRARTLAGAVAVDRGGSCVACSPTTPEPSNRSTATATATASQKSLLLRVVPPEVLSSDILSFLTTSCDRFALQATCRQFKATTDRPFFLSRLDIGGSLGDERGSGRRRGILLHTDDPKSAVAKLLPFSRAGSVQAIYMLGMLKAYCFDCPAHGIALLRVCANQGYVRAAYALGLILRDSSRDESRRWLARAAEAEYLPAWQELLPAQEMKARFGDLDAARLRAYMDFPCLNRLLGRHYVDSNPRCVQTSHCWNPLCGRWAYKNTPLVDLYLRMREARAERRRLRRMLEASASASASASAATATATAAADDSHVPGSPLFAMARDVDEATLNRAAQEAHELQPPSISLPGAGGRVEWTAPNPRRSHYDAAPANDDDGNDDGDDDGNWVFRVSRMKMCSSCRRAKYCSKLCQVYDWRSGRHKTECQYLG